MASVTPRIPARLTNEFEEYRLSQYAANGANPNQCMAEGKTCEIHWIRKSDRVPRAVGPQLHEANDEQCPDTGQSSHRLSIKTNDPSLTF